MPQRWFSQLKKTAPAALEPGTIRLEQRGRGPVASNDVAAVEHDGDERLPAQVAGCDCHAAAEAARREVAADQP